MCIRDRAGTRQVAEAGTTISEIVANAQKIAVTCTNGTSYACLLYTSDAADERSSVDLGGRRIITKKNTPQAPAIRPTHYQNHPNQHHVTKRQHETQREVQ